MSKTKILCVYDGGITKDLMEQMKELEQYGAEVSFVEDKEMYAMGPITDRMLLIEQNGVDAAPTCKEFLDAQIEILKPRIILLCGRVAVQSILNSNQGITKIRGKWFEGPNMSKMMPIFHPSYLLRNDSRDKGSPKWLMWQDIQEIKRVYSQMD